MSARLYANFSTDIASIKQIVTLTMKMLTRLLPPSEGQARLFGEVVDSRDLNTRRRIGYMTQSSWLYSELTVEQNLVLHARLFKLPEERIATRVQEMAQRFGLTEIMKALPDALLLGQRQRLSLFVIEMLFFSFSLLRFRKMIGTMA